MSTNWRIKEKQDLEDHINEISNLIKEYREKLLLSLEDPIERQRNKGILKQLEDLRQQYLNEREVREREIAGGQAALSVPPLKPPTGPFRVPQLPTQGIFGRETDLREIPDLLRLNDPVERGVQPLGLIGMGGVGKTTLAQAIGRLQGVYELYPDGVLWVELGPQPQVRLLLNEWGRELGIDLLPERDEAACRARLTEVLYNKRVFLIIDDVWEADAGGYFQVGGPYCRTLITTREPWIAQALATSSRTRRVHVLDLEASLALLRELAPEAVSSNEDMARRLCQRLECLPLALKLAGRLLANESYNTVRVQYVLGELTEKREARLNLLHQEGRLGLDEDNPVSLQAILGMSVERLNPVDQDRFAMLSVFGGEPLTWNIEPVAAVWECPIDEARDTVSNFVRRGLVEPRPKNRYWMHALLADYAAEMRKKRCL